MESEEREQREETPATGTAEQANTPAGAAACEDAKADDAEANSGASGDEKADDKCRQKKRDRRDEKASKWKQERKKRRTTRKRRPMGGAVSEEDSADSAAGGGAADEEEVEPRKAEPSEHVPRADGLLSDLPQEEKKKLRAQRKEAEIADFKQRCMTGATVVLDCEWEDQLSDRELKGLVQQVLYSYGANRSAVRPVQLVLSGVSETSETLKKLRKLAGFPQAWPGVTILSGPYIENFSSEADRRRLTYLTADTDNIVKTIDPNGVYIIGGIVDRNRLKGCTREKADAQEIATGRLPLQEHIDMGASCRVLTCNHVLDIILEHQRCHDWRATFEKCVPGRKKFLDQEPANADAGPTSAPTSASTEALLEAPPSDKIAP